MSPYIEPIRQLVALQHVDDEIHSIELELEAAPHEMEVLKKQFDEKNAELENKRDTIATIELNLRSTIANLRELKEQMADTDNKLMQIGNDREYQAVLREADNRKAATNSLLQQKSDQEAGLQQHQEEFNKIEKEWKLLKAQYEEFQQGMQQRVEDAHARRAELETKRAETAQQVPPQVLNRYEFIRNRLSHPVIVPVDECICFGCHIAIPPQDYIDLQRGNSIKSCPNCQRLIYWVRHFQEEALTETPAE